MGGFSGPFFLEQPKIAMAMSIKKTNLDEQRSFICVRNKKRLQPSAFILLLAKEGRMELSQSPKKQQV